MRFLRDKSGNYAMIIGLTSPLLIGGAGLATEGGMWLYKRQEMQGAADAAAISAATRWSVTKSSSNLTRQARGVTSTFGYVDGTDGATVTLHNPPTSGHYTSNKRAIEVDIAKTETRLLSGMFLSKDVTLHARSVAIAGQEGTGCVIALNETAASTVVSQGSSAVTLKACSIYDNSSNAGALVNGGSATISAESIDIVGGYSGGAGITTTDGINTGTDPAADPYASVSAPTYSGCDKTNFSSHTTQTINPGVYCKGMQFNAGAVVTFNPGTYIVDRDAFTVNGGATIKGTGVTIYLTSSTGSNYATVTINGGATVNLTAPTSGDYSGLIFFADRNAPTGTSYKFNGGSNQILGGALYAPKGAVQYSGGAVGSTACTQLIGDTVTFTGNAALAVDCSAYGTKPIGTVLTELVE